MCIQKTCFCIHRFGPVVNFLQTLCVCLCVCTHAHILQPPPPKKKPTTFGVLVHNEAHHLTPSFRGPSVNGSSLHWALIKLFCHFYRKTLAQNWSHGPSTRPGPRSWARPWTWRELLPVTMVSNCERNSPLDSVVVSTAEPGDRFSLAGARLACIVGWD